MIAVDELTATGDPARDAENVLHAVWAEAGEVRLPVDPATIAQGLGVEVYVASLTDGVSGMLVKQPGAKPAIYLQTADSRNRQRFTCAHELGHFVAKGVDREDEQWEYVEHRALLASQGKDRAEIYANRFAANLLMPRAAVHEAIERVGPSVDALASEFGVSADAMNFRLESLHR